MRTESYRGNANLRRSGVPISLSEERIKEWIKCANDPIYFIETYMKIINADGVLVNFKLWDFQRDIILSLKNNRKTIIATARQIGKSTTTCGFILWYIIFHATKTVALLANKADTAHEILGKIRFAYKHLPSWLKHGVDEWNKGSFVLENGSRVLASATSSDNISGYTVQLLFLDEVAKIEGWEEFFTAVLPTISGKETKFVMVSTPKGLNHFWEFWDGALKGTNGYNPIRVTWDRVPGRDLKWKQETLSSFNFDQQKFDQEYNVEFLGSSGTLISGWKLKQLVEVGIKTPIVIGNGLKQYETPEKEHIYSIVADVSEGKGLDHNAFSVIGITELPYKQVATFYDNLISPIEFAEILFQVAHSYNNAHILVENNINMGGQIADTLYYDFEYENIIHTENAGRDGKRISTGFGKETERGVRTTKTVKAVGCAILKLLIEQDKLIVNDLSTISEFSTFSRNKKSYQAEPGKFDDLVMGLVLFAWMTNQDYFKELNDINTLAKLREKTEEQIMDELIPFGIVDNGIDNIENPIENYIDSGGNWIFHQE